MASWVGKPVRGSTIMSRVLVLLAIILIISCDGNVNVSPVPDVPVNVEVNLNDIDNVALKQLGGYIYISGGVRGLIVYRKSQNEYKAYDRNCTFEPEKTCAVVSFHSSGFYIEDTRYLAWASPNPTFW